MVSIPALWLPILLSAVLVFVMSSIIHMAFRYHRNDFLPLPDEESVRAALGKQNLPPNQYIVPSCPDMKAAREPDMVRKFEEGPVAFITIRPKGQVNLGKHLVQWFLFTVGLGVMVAYLAGRTLAPGTEYGQVFRVAGTAALLGYTGALIWAGIWKGVPWSKVGKDVFDGVVYALVTAGAFAGFWPN